MGPKNRLPYPPAFRQTRVLLSRVGRTPEELARELEPNAQAIRYCVRQAKRDEGREWTDISLQCQVGASNRACMRSTRPVRNPASQ